MINVDGGNLHNITNTPDANDGNPTLSPDGQKLMFSSDRSGTFDLDLLSLEDGAEAIRLTDGPGNEVHPNWSADGDSIAFRSEAEADGNDQIFVTDPEGQSVKPLFSSEYNDESPVWSPGGERIAFSSDRASTGYLAVTHSIYVYNLRTARVDRVTQGSGDARYPAWRPRAVVGGP